MGYKARLGACLLGFFLLVIALMMHRFWDTTDPNMAQIQLALFMKNISMLGAALLIIYFGSGPLSIDKSLPSQK